MAQSPCIATRQGLCLESFGPAKIESVVVNIADVFEDYVRNVVEEHVDKVLPKGQLRNGNHQMVRLFTQGRDYKVAPDIYLLRGGRAIAVIDPKYKQEPNRADRYEMLAFCEALRVKCAIFVSPLLDGYSASSFYGKTPGDIEMHEVRINLASPDMAQEEEAFIDRLRRVVEPHVLAG